MFNFLRKKKKPTAGVKVEEFKLVDPDEKSVELKHISGKKGVVVGFLHGTYCPACMHQLSRSNRLAKKLAEEDIKLAWVMADEPSSIAAYKLATDPSPEFAMLPDKDPTVALKFGVQEKEVEMSIAPYVFYIDNTDTIQYVLDKKGDVHTLVNEDHLMQAIKVIRRAE